MSSNPAPRFVSTGPSRHCVGLEEAVVRGLAPDRGLYLPESLTPLPPAWWRSLSGRALPDISTEMARAIIGTSIPNSDLERIVHTAISFPAPLRMFTEKLGVLELFHGPTLAFKDFGARFMAQLLGYYTAASGRELTVLVATSGDTGGAVANGFLGTAGIRVVILYPAGKVSDLQERQLTTLGGNIAALRIAGTFDDCQRMVKDAFLDTEITARRALTSANSINIARLIPQSFYYAAAYAQLGCPEQGFVVSVPSGNFGNLTAGVLAKRIGLPLGTIVASTNCNDAVPRYLETGSFAPAPSKHTISNAMDVGNPSNFERLQQLYGGDLAALRAEICGYAFSDDQTRAAIAEIAEKHGYIADPHGAVGYLGLSAYQREHGDELPGIFFETAHPIKFREIVEPVVKRSLDLPDAVRTLFSRPQMCVDLPACSAALKDWVLSATPNTGITR